MTFANNFDAKYENDCILKIYILQYMLAPQKHTHTHTPTNSVFRKSYFHHYVNFICHFILKSCLLNDSEHYCLIPPRKIT